MERAAQEAGTVAWTLPPDPAGGRFRRFVPIFLAFMAIALGLVLVFPGAGWLAWTPAPVGTALSIFLQNPLFARADAERLTIGRSRLTAHRLPWRTVRAIAREGDSLVLSFPRRTLRVPLPNDPADAARLLTLAGAAP